MRRGGLGLRGWGGGGFELLLLSLLAGERAGEGVDELCCGGWLTLVKGSALVPSSPAGFLVSKVEWYRPVASSRLFFEMGCLGSPGIDVDAALL